MKVMIDLSVMMQWMTCVVPCIWLMYETWCIRGDGDVEFCLIVTHHLHLVYNAISRCMYVIMQPIIDPVARMTTVRFVLALSVLLSWRTSTIDFQNAFLNAPLTEDIYVYVPPGSEPLPDCMVYKMQRDLYGLKQSPREWNIKLMIYSALIA